MTITDDLRSLPLPPGSFGLPVIGETFSFLRNPNFVQQRQQQYGQIYKTHVFGCPTVVMIGAEANRFLFSNENRYFADGVSQSAPPQAKLLMGTGAIIMQTGDKHLQQRKLLAQAFQPRALAGYVDIMAATTYNYLETWERTGNFNWYLEIRKYTLDVACKLLVGIDVDNDFGKLYET